MDLKTQKFLNAVHAEIAWDRMDETVNGWLTCDAITVQKGWEELKPFLEWAEMEAPSWTEVEASIEDMESPAVCNALGNQTLAHIAKEI
jgi:hypothetical protein